MLKKFKIFILENRYLSFMILVSLLDLLSLTHNINTLVILIVSIVISIFMDKIGHILQYISINKLTSQLSETNLALAKSENRFRNFFNQTSTPMCIFNLKTKKFVACNKFLCDLIGYSEEELLKMKLEDLIYKDDLKDSFEVIKMNLNNQTIDRHENRYLTKDGKIISIEWKFTKGDEDGLSYELLQDTVSSGV